MSYSSATKSRSCRRGPAHSSTEYVPSKGGIETDLKRDKGLLLFTVAIIAVVLIGEVYVYTFNADNTYDAYSSADDSGISYYVSSGISNSYRVVITDNGDFSNSADYYVYYDSGYASNLNDVPQPIGAKVLTQEYYVSQLVLQLENRGVKNVHMLDAEGLKAALIADIDGDDCRKCLIVVSGALPDTVYKGNADDTIFEWISAGGRFYWAGNLIGSCYATEKELVPVVGYQELFFGTECLNTSDVAKAYSDIVGNDYRNVLSLMNNNVRYGVDVSKLSSQSLAVGYTEGGYSSIVFAEHGEGMICVLAGDYSNNQRADLAQVVASGLCYESELLWETSGSVTRETVNGNADVEVPAGYSSVYIYLGGYYLEYGACDSYFGTLRQ